MFVKDIKLIANDGTEIRVHREILASSSNVFDKILVNDTQIFVDADGKTLLEFVQFIYCGKVSNVQSFDRDLTRLACSYNLKSLKKMCDYSLSSKLTSENVIDHLLFAYHHKMKNLERRCKSTIREAELVLLIPTLFFDLWKMVEKKSKSLASMYTFAKTREKCKSLLNTELTPINVIDMMLFANYYKMDKLAVQCRQMIENSCMVFLEAPFFLAMWQLADDRLYVKD